jgi:pimeloyl-ACP methyl ester carboxylesterase
MVNGMNDDESLPILLLPGLNCSARLYAAQIPVLWTLGSVTVADHRRDDTMSVVARRILDAAPPRFRLAGLSMGGYIALEIMRQAPERAAKLALFDTSARADTPEQTGRRRELIALAREDRMAEINDILWPLLVHESRADDIGLRADIDKMAFETGTEAFIRQQLAIISRTDTRPALAAIRCPTLVVVGEGDRLTPPELARELAAGIPGARLETIMGSGHLTTMEKPDDATKLLADFFKG